MKQKKEIYFFMDEWDAVFHMSFMTEKEQRRLSAFLKLLLKGQSYVELAYMTGGVADCKNIPTDRN